jgi:transcription factor C subunit 6
VRAGAIVRAGNGDTHVLVIAFCPPTKTFATGIHSVHEIFCIMPGASRRARRVPRKSYTDDVFNTIQGLDISSASDTERVPASHVRDQRRVEEEDDDYGDADAAADDVAEASPDDGEALEAEDEGAAEYYSDSASDASGVLVTASSTSLARNQKKRKRASHDTFEIPELRSTGTVKNRLLSQGREGRLFRIVGPGEEDIIAQLRARDAWENALPLPMRTEREKYGGGMMRSPYHTAERQAREAKEGQQWYTTEGKATFRKLQVIDSIPGREDTAFVDAKHMTKEFFLYGTIRSPKLYELSLLQTFNLSKVVLSDSSQRSKSGWIIKTIPNVRVLEWAPHHNGSFQYLLVASRSSIGDKSEGSNGTAFEKGKPFTSCFYIWRFRTKASGNFHEMDSTLAPQLRAIVSFDWDGLKEAKWCPVSTISNPDEGFERIGLLAGVFLDGSVRVIDVSVPKSDKTEHLHLSRVAFESKPPDSMCTSITWASLETIFVGCSNGAVAVWNIANALRQNLKSAESSHATSNARPWFYKRLMSTYILNVESGFPSRPHYLFCNAADGQCNFFDMRDPRADTSGTVRPKTGQLATAWQDVLQGWLIPDEQNSLKASYPRGFSGLEGVTKFDSTVVHLATSINHHVVLAGCIDGTVSCANTLRKMMLAKVIAAEGYTVLDWFRYEWRRPITQNLTRTDEIGVSLEQNGFKASLPSTANLDGTPVQASISPKEAKSVPISRFVEGLKSKTVAIAGDGTAASSDEGRIPIPVFDMHSSISRVCWNPNICCGGWAAAATGSGLIRIEDLSIP